MKTDQVSSIPVVHDVISSTPEMFEPRAAGATPAAELTLLEARLKSLRAAQGELSIAEGALLTPQVTETVKRALVLLDYISRGGTL